MSNRKDAKHAADIAADEKRREALKRIGRYAAATPPAVALLLAAASKPAKALIPSASDTNDGV